MEWFEVTAEDAHVDSGSEDSAHALIVMFEVVGTSHPLSIVADSFTTFEVEHFVDLLRLTPFDGVDLFSLEAQTFNRSVIDGEEVADPDTRIFFLASAPRD